MVLLFENKKEVIPVIQTTAGLEYMISTKIKSLIEVDKKTVGIAHLDSENPLKTDNLSAQLNQHYNFKPVDLKNAVPLDMDVLLLTSAVDTIDSMVRENLESFIKAGKKILITQSGLVTDIQTQQANPIDSDIFDFLSQYGLSLKKNLVLDKKCGSVQVQERRGIFMMNRPMEYPFFPVVQKFNSDEVIVSDLEQVLTFFPSEIVLDTIKNENVMNTRSLFETSNNSGLMEGNFMLSPDPQQNPFINALGQKGKTLAAISKLSNGGELILISDSKFLSDEGGLSIEGNLVFLMNAVDYLAGDKELIALRSREITSRPLEEMEDSSKRTWKYANMFLPSFLIIVFGFYRIREDKKKAEILRQIYD
jgi:ABC-type uncharacterized transport system involved in gliding motility auxiliary subunit